MKLQHLGVGAEWLWAVWRLKLCGKKLLFLSGVECCGEAKYCKRCEAEPELSTAVESRSNCVATV